MELVPTAAGAHTDIELIDAGCAGSLAASRVTTNRPTVGVLVLVLVPLPVEACGRRPSLKG